ncbi:hypothetical protein BHE90_008791 [Fusarium euwallaceae]|uniref:Uncharacterized protein n=2 Tax=Fusarium solani species complex TaxID=232080 RepID=A0A430LLZ1_9HYPO|nr:hypothetical protein BHE90_008791 [Fusarium euwallaceae]
MNGSTTPFRAPDEALPSNLIHSLSLFSFLLTNGFNTGWHTAPSYPSIMPQFERPTSISSVDQLFELVEGLDETQIHSLLVELNNTVPSNIPVSHGVEMFEHPGSKKPISAARASSIRRSFKLTRMLSRSKSKRVSSAPAPSPSRPRTAMPPGPKHYRRISRPVLPTLASGPDLNALLSAYLAPTTPPSKPKTSSPSSMSSLRSISTSSTMSFEAEDADMDILAPLVFGRPQQQRGQIGDIFEVLEF